MSLLLCSGGRGRPSQLVELAEHFVDDGFHFISDDGQSEHRLASFTELRNQRTKGIADGLLNWLGKLGPLGLKAGKLGIDVCQFWQSCCGAGLVFDGSDTVGCVLDQNGGVTDELCAFVLQPVSLLPAFLSLPAPFLSLPAPFR